MARKKPSALEALERVNIERLALVERASQIKQAAALELGVVVLEAGGATLGLDRLRSIIEQATAERPDDGARRTPESAAVGKAGPPDQHVGSETDND